MFGLEILEVAIGVIFVYILVSILCTAIREGVEGLLKTRAAYLWLGVRELLHDRDVQGLANHFYNHPLIFSLFPGGFDTNKKLDKPGLLANGRGAPSYIPARNFAVALMDIAARGPITDETTSTSAAPLVSLENIRANIANMQNAKVQRVLLNAVDSAQGDLNKAQKNIEDWFNSAMDRVSGWYKRTTQVWLFLIGLLIAVGMNVNTLTIIDYLYTHPAARQSVVKEADALLEQWKANPDAVQKDYDAAKGKLNSLELPIGWDSTTFATRAQLKDWSNWGTYIFVPLVGWLLTAFAATLGAPFWFDILNKVMVIRATVKPHEKSPEEGSEDRQPKPQQLAAPAAQQQQQQQPEPQQPQQAGTAAPPSPPSQPPPGQQTLPERIASDIEANVDACDITDMGDTKDDQLPKAETKDGGAQ